MIQRPSRLLTALLIFAAIITGTGNIFATNKSTSIPGKKDIIYADLTKIKFWQNAKKNVVYSSKGNNNRNLNLKTNEGIEYFDGSPKEFTSGNTIVLRGKKGGSILQTLEKDMKIGSIFNNSENKYGLRTYNPKTTTYLGSIAGVKSENDNNLMIYLLSNMVLTGSTVKDKLRIGDEEFIESFPDNYSKLGDIVILQKGNINNIPIDPTKINLTIKTDSGKAVILLNDIEKADLSTLDVQTSLTANQTFAEFGNIKIATRTTLHINAVQNVSFLKPKNSTLQLQGEESRLKITSTTDNKNNSVIFFNNLTTDDKDDWGIIEFMAEGKKQLTIKGNSKNNARKLGESNSKRLKTIKIGGEQKVEFTRDISVFAKNIEKNNNSNLVFTNDIDSGKDSTFKFNNTEEVIFKGNAEISTIDFNQNSGKITAYKNITGNVDNKGENDTAKTELSLPEKSEIKGTIGKTNALDRVSIYDKIKLHDDVRARNFLLHTENSQITLADGKTLIGDIDNVSGKDYKGKLHLKNADIKGRIGKTKALESIEVEKTATFTHTPNAKEIYIGKSLILNGDEIDINNIGTKQSKFKNNNSILQLQSIEGQKNTFTLKNNLDPDNNERGVIILYAQDKNQNKSDLILTGPISKASIGTNENFIKEVKTTGNGKSLITEYVTIAGLKKLHVDKESTLTTETTTIGKIVDINIDGTLEIDLKAGNISILGTSQKVNLNNENATLTFKNSSNSNDRNIKLESNLPPGNGQDGYGKLKIHSPDQNLTINGKDKTIGTDQNLRIKELMIEESKKVKIVPQVFAKNMIINSSGKTIFSDKVNSGKNGTIKITKDKAKIIFRNETKSPTIDTGNKEVTINIGNNKNLYVNEIKDSKKTTINFGSGKSGIKPYNKNRAVNIEAKVINVAKEKDSVTTLSKGKYSITGQIKLGNKDGKLNLADGVRLDGKINNNAGGTINILGNAKIDKIIGKGVVNSAGVNKTLVITNDITSGTINFGKTKIIIKNDVKMGRNVNFENSEINLGSNSLNISNGSLSLINSTINASVNNNYSGCLITNPITDNIIIDGQLNINIDNSRNSLNKEKPIILIKGNTKNLDITKIITNTKIPNDIWIPTRDKKHNFVLVSGNNMKNQIRAGLDKEGIAQGVVSDKTINSLINAKPGSKAFCCTTSEIATMDDTKSRNDTLQRIANQNPVTNALLINIDNINDEILSRISSISSTNVDFTPFNVLIAENDTITGIAAGSLPHHHGLWINPLYANGNQQRLKDTAGYKLQTYGGTIGFDTKINEDTIVGISFTATNTDVKYKDFKTGDNSKIDNMMLSLYGAYQIDNNWFTQGILGVGKTIIKNNETRRTSNNTNQTAKGKYSSKTFFAELLTGYNYASDCGFTITPMAGFNFTFIDGSRYKETGTTNQNLDVVKKATKRIETIAGVKISSPNSFGFNNVSITPEIYSFIKYDLVGCNPKTEVRLEGADGEISIKKASMNRIFYNLGFGLNAKHNQMEYGTYYDLNLANKFIGYQLSAKIQWNF